MLSAVDLHQRGLAASNAGRHASARSAFEKALDRADDNEIRARIELSLAYTEGELDTVDRGVTRCLRALDLPDVPEPVRGLIWSQLGLLHMRAGDGQAAQEALEQARTLIASDDHRPLGTLHLTLGNIYLQRHEPAPAIECFETSIREYAAIGMTTQADKATHNLGYAHLLAGDLVRALQLMDRAHDSFVTLGPVYEAVGDQDRAEVLIAAGMPTGAAQALRSAAEAFARRRMRKRQAEALLVLARLLLREDPVESRRVARRAMRLFTGNGSSVWALRAEAVSVEAEIVAGPRRSGVVTEAVRLADRLGEHGLAHDSAALTLQAARVAVRAGDLVSAEKHLAAAEIDESSPLANRLLTHEVHAELAAARAEQTVTRRHAREGLAELHDWQATFGSLDLQSSLSAHGRGLAMLGLRSALDDGSPEVVFEWAERARALATRVAPVRPTVGPQRADELQRLRALAAQTETGDPRASTELVELRRQIRESAWRNDGSGIVTEPISLDETQARLAEREGCLVAHLVTDDRLHALVITPTDARVVPLGAFAPVRALLQGLQADLDVSAAHLPSVMRSVVLDSLCDRLQRLSDHLIAPLAEHLTGRRVAALPSGPLIGMPWHLLDGLRGIPLTVPRSTSLWLSAPARPAPPSSALLVAGPHVHRADEEVRRSATHWSNARVLSGPEATTATVAAAATEVDVLHIAAHGRHSADNPLFSGISLHDGPWFGYDIDGLSTCPTTVLLSACELGRSTIRWAEEAVGMPSAWLHAGTRVVIGSPASVDDDVACEVLATTHRGLAAGQCASDALAEATADLPSRSLSTFMCIGAGW